MYNIETMTKKKKTLKPINMKNKKTTKGKNKKKDPKQEIFKHILTVVLVIVLLTFVLSPNLSDEEDNKISLSQVATNITEERVTKIEIEGDNLKIFLKDSTEKEAKKEIDSSLTETLVNLGVTPSKLNQVNIETVTPTGLKLVGLAIAPFIPMLIILGVLIWLFTRGTKGAGGGGAMQAFSFGNSRAKFIDPADNKNRVTFQDVAGAAEAKEELAEVVDFLKNPKKFLQIGAEIPKGVLMMGQPGTGKTLLARAVAGEAKVPFFSVSASEFVEMFVGVGASRVRDLFAQAKKQSPAIIFIDEVDAIGRARGGGTGGGNDEREQTLNQILVEMDGFEASEKVIVIAATNRPEVLDRALLRPGRFDRRVNIDLPDRKDREKILKIHGKRKPFGADVKLDIIAARTPGFSGADLFSVMNEAAIFAAREDRKKVSQFDLAEAVDKVAMGPERKSHIMSDEEKQITAYHELGHALIASVTEDADPVNKITIIPRGRAAGVTMTLPDEDRKMRTKNDFLADLDVFMGGYLAEKLIFGDVSTGPSNDLARATDMARDMVTKFGMSEKVGVLTLSNAHKNLMGASDESTVKYSAKTVSYTHLTLPTTPYV